MGENWEHIIFEATRKILRPGDTCIDIGANDGCYSQHFLDCIGSSGKLICIEPGESCFKILKKKFRDKKNVEILNICISDQHGWETLYYQSDSKKSNILGHDTNFDKGQPVGVVKAETLNDLIRSPADFIKIDTEGAELKILQGADQAINHIKTMLIECHYVGHWKEIKEILIKKYQLEVTDLLTGGLIDIDTKEKPYQIIVKNSAL